MNDTIGIIGKGIVGSAIYNGLIDNNYSVSFYDPNIRNTKSLDFVVNNSHILFICVPTPSNSDGSIDLSIINNVSKILFLSALDNLPPSKSSRFDFFCAS